MEGSELLLFCTQAFGERSLLRLSFTLRLVIRAGDPTPDQKPDNTGTQRADQEGRAQTDRPADLNPNLMPDKVKGQMSPGGSMPSITLKGVSIKGTSTVKFEEAAATAQAEAQSALNQDKVPRSYQNNVRDYFDDLKK